VQVAFPLFGANELLPPSRYRDAQFDFVYLWSVFTHLTEEQQLLWMAEFARVIRPGGYLLISTNGQRYLNRRELPQSAKDRFRVGQLVVLNPEATSSAETYGACDVYHPLAYVKEKLTQHFAWLDGVETVHGDYHLFRR
jgi:ubiquinone/menaquinone biosynthesis C-methylase UbiE